MQFLEDPAVSESNSGSAWLLEEDAVLSPPMLSQRRGWAAPWLEPLSAAALRPEPPGWDGAAGPAVPCSSPAVPPGSGCSRQRLTPAPRGLAPATLALPAPRG